MEKSACGSSENGFKPYVMDVAYSAFWLTPPGTDEPRITYHVSDSVVCLWVLRMTFEHTYSNNTQRSQKLSPTNSEVSQGFLSKQKQNYQGTTETFPFKSYVDFLDIP